MANENQINVIGVSRVVEMVVLHVDGGAHVGRW